MNCFSSWQLCKVKDRNYICLQKQREKNYRILFFNLLPPRSKFLEGFELHFGLPDPSTSHASPGFIAASGEHKIRESDFESVIRKDERITFETDIGPSTIKMFNSDSYCDPDSNSHHTVDQPQSFLTNKSHNLSCSVSNQMSCWILPQSG
jgi:hypothetical protein